MKTMTLLLASSLALFAVGPKSGKPQVPVPEQWSPGLPAGQASDLSVLRTWWESFHDLLLTSLIDRALESNLDLKLALARVAESRAARGLAKSDLLPSVNFFAGVTHLRGGIAQGLSRVGVLPGTSQSRASLISPFETNIFQAGFDSSWELDLFGGLRKAVNAADADLLAVKEGQNDVRVTLAAEIGRNYMTLRGAQRRLAIVSENVALQSESLALTESRHIAGLAPALDAVRAAAQLSETRADAPLLEAEIDRSVHALSVLLGRSPADLVSELRPDSPLPAAPTSLPVGVPADLLRRRPDLRRAEAEIAAAAARVGAAQSDFYPKLTLTSLVGRQATEASNFGLGIGNFFSLGPALRLPIFTGGRIRSNIKVQDARLDQVQVAYENTVLQALADVENALSAARRDKERVEQLRAAEGQNRDAAGLTRELYSKGLGDYLAVIDAQRQLLAAQQQLAQSETSVLLDFVALYKALGGGW
jgi:NodT family efflux transporter outer membrane factor (OMF) lipoprotein